MDRLMPKGPDAMGYVGVRCDPSINQHAVEIVEWNVSGIVGTTHNWQVYEGSSVMMRQIVPKLFGA